MISKRNVSSAAVALYLLIVPLEAFAQVVTIPLEEAPALSPMSLALGGILLLLVAAFALRRSRAGVGQGPRRDRLRVCGRLCPLA